MPVYCHNTTSKFCTSTVYVCTKCGAEGCTNKNCANYNWKDTMFCKVCGSSAHRKQK